MIFHGPESGLVGCHCQSVMDAGAAEMQVVLLMLVLKVLLLLQTH